MKNIAKKPRSASKSRKPFILGILALIVLIWVPIPMGFVVRPLLDSYSLKLSKQIHWKSVRFQLARGLVFDSLHVKINKKMRVASPMARVQFSWFALASLEARVTALRADTLTIHWRLPGKGADATLTDPIPTESHLVNVAIVLDSLSPLLSQSGVDLQSEYMALQLTKDEAFVLRDLDAEIESKQDSTWKLDLEAHDLEIADWPLPDLLLANLDLSPHQVEVGDLEACWKGGCLQGEGRFSERKNSHFSFQIDDIPLLPFAHFALPQSAMWNGTVHGAFDWSGRVAHPKTWEGKGSLRMEKMRVAQWPFQKEGLVANLASVFQSELVFQKFEITDFQIEKGAVEIGSMNYQTEMFEGSGKGRWRFPESLYFQLNGTIAKETYLKLPGITRLALEKEDHGGAKFQVRLEGNFRYQKITPTHNTVGTFFKNLFD